jgi:hypothetical protein
MNRLSTPMRRQAGMGLLGMLIIAAFVACLVLVGLKVVPTALEYQAVVKAVQKAHTENSIPNVRKAFDRSAQIDDIASITGNDLEVTPPAAPGQPFGVAFAYQKKIPLFGPASLVLDYKGSTP